MSKQFFSTLKVFILALVLSFGLSYALAWTAPSVPPPNGNTDAPLNVGSIPQTKVGGDICTTVSGTTKCLQDASGPGSIDPAPIGSIVSYAGATPPAGYLICNGASLLRTGTYASLYAAIGTTYGAVDATHFSLPDLRGEFIRGVDSRTVAGGSHDPDGPRALGSAQADLFKSHTHSESGWLAITGYMGTGSGRNGAQTTGATGGTETRPRNVALNYIIKAVNNSEMVLVSSVAADNLGNHTATTSLNMAGNSITNAGAITAGGEIDATGGTGTSYTTAPIEVRTTLTPRLAFHWPGSAASQIGMDSAGTIRTYDNPGTGYANFTAAGITATNRLTVSEAGGAYTYITLRDDDSPSGVKYIHANGNAIGFLNSGGGWSSYWDNSNNQFLYGSLRSMGYLVSPRGVFLNGQVTCTGGISYTSTNYTCNSPQVITAGGIIHPVGRYPYTDDNLGVVSMRGVCGATGGSMLAAAVRVDGSWQTVFSLSGSTAWSPVTGINLVSVTCSY